ncbi:unnamed protein product, partial [Cyprideis torosa]
MRPGRPGKSNASSSSHRPWSSSGSGSDAPHEEKRGAAEGKTTGPQRLRHLKQKRDTTATFASKTNGPTSLGSSSSDAMSVGSGSEIIELVKEQTAVISREKDQLKAENRDLQKQLQAARMEAQAWKNKLNNEHTSRKGKTSSTMPPPPPPLPHPGLGVRFESARVETLDALEAIEELRDAEELKSKILFSIIVLPSQFVGVLDPGNGGAAEESLAFRSVLSTQGHMRDALRRILQVPPASPPPPACTPLALVSKGTGRGTDEDPAILALDNTPDDHRKPAKKECTGGFPGYLDQNRAAATKQALVAGIQSQKNQLDSTREKTAMERAQKFLAVHLPKEATTPEGTAPSAVCPESASSSSSVIDLGRRMSRASSTSSSPGILGYLQPDPFSTPQMASYSSSNDSLFASVLDTPSPPATGAEAAAAAVTPAFPRAAAGDLRRRVSASNLLRAAAGDLRRKVSASNLLRSVSARMAIKEPESPKTDDVFATEQGVGEEGGIQLEIEAVGYPPLSPVPSEAKDLLFPVSGEMTPQKQMVSEGSCPPGTPVEAEASGTTVTPDSILRRFLE